MTELRAVRHELQRLRLEVRALLRAPPLALIPELGGETAEEGAAMPEPAAAE